MIKSPTEITLLVLLVACVTYMAARSQATVQNQPEPSPYMQQAPLTQIIQSGGDSRYSRAPRPQRQWDIGLEIPVRGALDPIPTRGGPEEYQQMGVLTSSDGKALPLYGRRTAPRSDFFNYYTRTDTYNPVALPIKFKKRDCQDNVGCSEVMDGDEVKLAATGENAKVTLYGFDGPRYVPP
jgi:hypothetical protein